MNPISLKTKLLSVAFVYGAFSLTASDFLPTATPESQGVPSQAVLEYVQAAEAHPDRAAHSFIIIRNGHAIAEGYWTPYAKDQPHELFSLSKSFTSTAVGLAVEEGLLNIDDRIVDLFSESVPENATDHMKNMQLRHLLSMSTGHEVEPANFWMPVPGKTHVQTFLESKPEQEPGSLFLYNTPATYMQSALVQKLTGQRVRDYLMPRLFDPLGIDKPKWDQSSDGVDFGGFGLYLTTRDIAKFGQLLLQKGQWKGEQLIPADWLEMANRKQVSNGEGESDWNSGYGFQFWMNSTEGFRGDGAFGQLCIVLPEKNMVVAMNAATTDMGQEMRWIWDILLPALSEEALPENPEAQTALQAKLESLVISLPEGKAAPEPSLTKDSGTYAFEQNIFGIKTARIYDPDDQGQLTLDLEFAEGTFSLPIGFGKWTEADFIRSSMFGTAEASKAFISGAWKRADTLNINVVYEGRCQMFRMQFQFGESLIIKPSVNVGFGPSEFPSLTGTRVE